MIDMAVDAQGAYLLPAAILTDNVPAKLTRVHLSGRRPADLTKSCNIHTRSLA